MNQFKGGFGGGFGGGNIQQLMRQAQKMQEEMEVAKKQISESEFTGVSGGGMVTSVVLGTRKLKSISIKKEVVDADDVEMLEDLIVASVNDALLGLEKMEKEKLPQGM